MGELSDYRETVKQIINIQKNIDTYQMQRIKRLEDRNKRLTKALQRMVDSRISTETDKCKAAKFAVKVLEEE